MANSDWARPSKKARIKPISNDKFIAWLKKISLKERLKAVDVFNSPGPSRG